MKVRINAERGLEGIEKEGCDLSREGYGKIYCLVLGLILNA